MAISRVKLTDGAELNVHVDGSGPDLMLVTGLGGTASYWDAAVPDLVKSFRLIRFDQRVALGLQIKLRLTQRLVAR